MENLMIKAIEEFKKTHRNFEIRSCFFEVFHGGFKKITSALFRVEYVDEWGFCYESYISVGQEKKTNKNIER